MITDPSQKLDQTDQLAASAKALAPTLGQSELLALVVSLAEIIPSLTKGLRMYHAELARIERRGL